MYSGEVQILACLYAHETSYRNGASTKHRDVQCMIDSTFAIFML